jgi:signal transduction histidine kinase
MFRELKQGGPTRLARGLAFAVFVAGLAATTLLVANSRRQHERDLMRVFAAESEAMRQSVVRQLDLFFEVLDSLGALHDLSDRITPRDFEEFSSKGMQFQRRLLGRYGFVQRIPLPLRVALERDEAAALRVVELGRDGQWINAALRPEYFPLIYQHPENGLGLPLGADVGALPGGDETMARMMERDGPAVARFMQQSDEALGTGYLVFSPFQRRAEEAESERQAGFIVSVLWPHQLLDRALADVATRDVLVRFYDPELHPGVARDVPDERLALQADITVADRVWRFETTASTEYLDARRTRLPVVLAGAGGVITLLLSATIWVLAGRTQRIEAAVKERTRALEAANQTIKSAMQERIRLEGEILEISEREKRQVGQDLHDSLGQKLTGAVFLSRALAGHLDGRDAEAHAQAGRINGILKESVAQVRRMARGLSPVELGEEGLPGALQRLAAETSDIYGINCLFHHEEHAEQAMPEARLAPQLYAIALEAVNNAVRHGGAKEILIELSGRDGAGHLVVEDDGAGFDPGKTIADGMGLRIMRYRAGLMDGRLDITRREPSGIKVQCDFPLA